MKSSRLLAAVFLAVSFVMGVGAYAQTTTQGAISGTVSDATGAVVGKASITILNVGTNATLILTSDDSGFYKAPLLEPGTYTVTVKAPGFSEYRATNVLVQVGQQTDVSPKLKAGETSAVVEVTAEAPLLNFDSPDFSSNINTRQLEGVPVNNRRWSALALSTPNVVPDSSGFGLVSVRGISPILNNVMIDGADDNQAYYAEERGRTREAYSTSGSAVREFQMNTGVYAAEYGRAAGGVINSVTKSGTNTLHGEAYFYDRESNWNAYNNYTTNTVALYANGGTIPSGFVFPHFKPEDLRKIYGFTVGGPIIKDRLFFMYTYDQHTHINPGIAKASNPASFFAQPDANLPAGATCNVSGANAGYLTGTTTTNSNYTLDSQACTLAAREGLATYAAGAAAYSTGLANFLPDLGYVARAGYQEINTPKLDWQVNSKQHVSLLYHRLRWDSPGDVQTAAANAYAIDSWGTDFVKLDYGVAKLTSLVKPTISNEILYQYGRELNDEGQQPFSAYTLTNLQGTGASAGNIPEVNMNTGTGFILGSPYYSYRKALPDERKWQVADTLFFTKGNHSFKFGADIVHNSDLINNTYESNGYYQYNFIGNYLADLASKGGATSTCNSTQVSAASATGANANATGTYQCYSEFQQGFGAPVFAIATMDYGIFAQDNWKFSPRLTFEIGLRYDQELLPTPSIPNAAVPATANHPSDKNNFGPRLGFSYDVYGSGKTVLRGGYGMYYGRITNGVLLNTLLNSGSASGQYTSNFFGTASSAAPSPRLPNIVTGNGALVSPAVDYLDANLQNPMVHEYDLILQQEVGKGTVFSMSYVGALGRELPNFLNTNLNPNTKQTSTVTFVDTTGKGPVPNGTQVQVPTYTSYTNPSYQAIIDVISNINSSYNAFTAEIQNRSLHMIQFDAHYTWSHALDFNQNAITTTSSSTNWLDPYAAARTNYGNSSYNVPNRFVAYALYNFPNAVNKSSWWSYLANNWSLNNSFQMGSGLPYSAAPQSAKTTSGSITTGWNGSGNTSYIAVIGRNTYKYPRHIVLDSRLQKDIPFGERYNLQLFVNVFNVANHQNIDGINTQAYTVTATSAATSTFTYSPTFQSVTSSNNSGFLFTPRNVEIAAKFTF
jgi:hypothetical protein